MIRPIVEVPTLKDFRRSLIAKFVERQAASREYLSLKDDVAAFMANNRAEGDDGAAALGELMRHASVGTFDGEGAPLLLMRDTVAVEYLDIVQSDICQSFCGGSIPPAPVLVTSGDLKQMRGVSVNGSMESSDGWLHVAMSGDDIVMSQIMPYCWAKRGAVVALLRKLGFDPAAMSWPSELIDDLDEVFTPYPLLKDPTPKTLLTCELLKLEWPRGSPDKMSAASMAGILTRKYKARFQQRRDGRQQSITKIFEDDIKRALGRKS